MEFLSSKKGILTWNKVGSEEVWRRKMRPTNIFVVLAIQFVLLQVFVKSGKLMDDSTI